MILQERKIYGGMNITPDDEHDFRFGAIDVKPEYVPNIDFGMQGTLKIKDQKNSDLCTAFGASTLGEAHEGKEISPEYLFAKTKEIKGDYKSWGANLREVCQAAVDVGFLPQENSPYSLAENGREFVADWNNWASSYKDIAYPFRQQSYFLVDGFGKDVFDSVRTVLWKYRDKNTGVITGVIWQDYWTYIANGIIPNQKGKGNFGHAFAFVGQKIINNTPFLIAHLSNGEDIGDKGYFYFSREATNRECIYKNFAFIDLPPDKTKEEIKDKSVYLARGIFGRAFFLIDKWWERIMQ